MGDLVLEEVLLTRVVLWERLKVRYFRYQVVQALESSVFTGVPNVRDLVEILELLGNSKANFMARHFEIKVPADVSFNQFDDSFFVSLRYGTLPACCENASQDVLAIEGDSRSILLDDHQPPG